MRRSSLPRRPEPGTVEASRGNFTKLRLADRYPVRKLVVVSNQRPIISFLRDLVPAVAQELTIPQNDDFLRI
jgi:hypothetical protein